MVADLEVRIVDPDGMVLDGDAREALAVAGQQVQARFDVGADAIDVHAPVIGEQRLGVEDRGRRDVLVQ